jgi:hypothetical protein
MSDVLTTPRRKPAGRPSTASAFSLAVVVVLSLVAASRLVPAKAHFIHRISIVNPLGYQVETEAAQSERQGWLGLGTTQRERTESFEEVFDLGSAWLFRFSYAGTGGGELLMSRQKLRAAGWRVVVPAEVGRRLEAAGLEPSSGAQ